MDKGRDLVKRQHFLALVKCLGADYHHCQWRIADKLSQLLRFFMPSAQRWTHHAVIDKDLKQPSREISICGWVQGEFRQAQGEHVARLQGQCERLWGEGRLAVVLPAVELPLQIKTSWVWAKAAHARAIVLKGCILCWVKIKRLSEYRIKQASQVCACACLQTLKPRLRLEASTTVKLVRGISRVRAWFTSKETDKGDRDYCMHLKSNFLITFLESRRLRVQFQAWGLSVRSLHVLHWFSPGFLWRIQRNFLPVKLSIDCVL